MRIIKQNIIKYSIKINSSWEQHPLRHVLHRIWVFSHPWRESGDDDDDDNCDDKYDRTYDDDNCYDKNEDDGDDNCYDKNEVDGDNDWTNRLFTTSRNRTQKIGHNPMARLVPSWAA